MSDETKTDATKTDVDELLPPAPADDTVTVQIAIDCADPHALSRFWAEALHVDVEDHSGLIDQLLAQGLVTEEEHLTEIDGKWAFKDAAACRDPKGRLPRLLFQTVPEDKTVKNRVHLDVHVGMERRPAEIERLEGLGAKHLWDGQQGPQTWVTMADPEGNEFCVS